MDFKNLIVCHQSRARPLARPLFIHYAFYILSLKPHSFAGPCPSAFILLLDLSIQGGQFALSLSPRPPLPDLLSNGTIPFLQDGPNWDAGREVSPCFT